MSFWDTIKDLTHTDAVHNIYVRIPKERCDVAFDDRPLVADKSYFRVWLKEMFLGDARKWFKTWYPAVTCSVRVPQGAGSTPTFTRVTGTDSQNLGPGVLQGYATTDLLPFRGGVVEIEASLLALQGQNYLITAIKILKSMSELVGPPMSTAISVADKVTSGIEDLFKSTGGELHLGFHDAFSSGGPATTNPLRAGYHVVIRGSAAEIDASRLWVRSDQLYYAAKPGATAAPLVGHDYMLFFIEARLDRDDWRRLRSIEEPLDQAIQATVTGDEKRLAAYRDVAIWTALTSPDLAVQDRRRVVTAIKAELAAAAGEESHGAVPDGEMTLTTMMERSAPSVEEAMAMGKMTPEEAFSS
ncbi:MAG: hypothetical protein ABJE95_08465 [Byssovorax sp.]